MSLQYPITRIISRTKKWRGTRPALGFHRVMAIVRIGRRLVTRHVDTQDDKTGFYHYFKKSPRTVYSSDRPQDAAIVFNQKNKSALTPKRKKKSHPYRKMTTQ